MCLYFGGAEGEVVGVAGDILVTVHRGDGDGDVGGGNPAALLGRVVPCKLGRHDAAVDDPLDGGGRIGVGRFALQTETVVDARNVRPSDGHFVRRDWKKRYSRNISYNTLWLIPLWGAAI